MKLFNTHSPELDKFIDSQKAKNLLDIIIETKENNKLIKLASTNNQVQETAVTLLIKAISDMNLKVNIDIGELLKKISDGQDQLVKEAKTKSNSEQNTIKIASKELKDSHYEIDVCKEEITKKGTSLIMVSAYMKEAYLGRYLIKRNYYFASGNKNESDYIYKDLTDKFERIKQRYYDSKISCKEIFTEAKTLLDATKGDFECKDEDHIGTTVSRDTSGGHEVNGPMYSALLEKG